MMRLFTLALLFLLSVSSALSQTKDFIQIETNKTLCLFSFLETAKNARGTSSSFHDFIMRELGQDNKFQAIVKKYAELNLNDQFKKENYPENRHPFREVKDFLWIASSNSSSIEDFSQRIIGFLPNSSQQQLITLLRQVEPYYDKIVWEKEQANIKRIEEQLTPYKGKIEQLFLKVSNFYGASWSKEIPFRIMLYPIPLASGNTVAIPKGNALICSFLSKKENDFEGILGIIVHEMCHILYDEQPIGLQNNVDAWFKQSTSEWSKLAYSYTDEGLATAIGNGWAYKQLHGELDTLAWYNNAYIDGFAHALYPQVAQNLDNGGKMDQAFVEKAIELFENKFPNAIRETDILMNEITLFANSEDNEAIETISHQMRRNFRIRSQWFSTPISDPNSARHFGKQQTTKFFLIEKNQQASLKYIHAQFEDMPEELSSDEEFLYSFKDAKTQSAVIVLNLNSLESLGKGLSKLRESKYLVFDKVLKF